MTTFPLSENSGRDSGDVRLIFSLRWMAEVRSPADGTTGFPTEGALLARLETALEAKIPEGFRNLPALLRQDAICAVGWGKS